MPSYTRTTQQWQWLIGKLWYGHYRWDYSSNVHEEPDYDPFVTVINEIQAKLDTGNPVDHGITVHIHEFHIGEMGEEYADAIRRSGTLGRQPQHGVLPELLEHVPGENAHDPGRSETLPHLRYQQGTINPGSIFRRSG